jgi:hypothetical protein
MIETDKVPETSDIISKLTSLLALEHFIGSRYVTSVEYLPDYSASHHRRQQIFGIIQVVHRLVYLASSLRQRVSVRRIRVQCLSPLQYRTTRAVSNRDMCEFHRVTDRGLPAAPFQEPREDTNYSSSVLSSSLSLRKDTLQTHRAV